MKKSNPLKNRSLNTFFKYSIKHKTLLITTVLLSFLASGLGALPAWLIKYLVDEVLIDKNVQMLVLVISGLILSSILKGFASYFTDVRSSYVTEIIRREIKIDVFKHLQILPISYYKKNKLGDIMARLSGDATMLGRIGFLIFDILKSFTLVLILVGRLFQVSVLLSIISLMALPGMMALIKKYTVKLRRAGRVRQDIAGELNAYTQETLSGINIIKAFATEDKTIEKYREVNMNEFDSSMRAMKIKAKVSPLNEVVATVMISLVAGYGCYLVVVTNSLTAGELISFITALGLMQSPIKGMIKKNNELQEILPSADRVLEILDVENEQDYYGDLVELKEKIDRVKFENVSFTYDFEKELVVKNFNLNVNPGEVIALVGKSGSGKTTLVNLIPRFYEVSQGSIKVNDVNIKNYSLKEYRKHIGIVPQETFLFSGTIASNIAYGRDNISFEDITKAAKMANAYDFIMEFEEGFDTEVGERGVLMSGGQKQRIAIARALVQDPEIMILDEATSALDTESERLVQDALDKLMKGRTTFVIAHRLSTIINADKIVVMEKGEIKEIGNHRDLLIKGGIYKKLYETQFGKTNQEANND